MSYLKLLLKCLFLCLLFILSFSFFNTILYYFNIIPKSIFIVITLITPILSFLIGSYFLGKKASKKGWLEGLKLGGICILLFLFLNRITGNSFHLRLIFYDAILLFSSSLGGMIGINKKETSP